MKKNEDDCQDMDISEILYYFRTKYTNVKTRSSSLSQLKKKFLKTKEPAFCNQFKLSYEEYKQINSLRQVQLIKKCSHPQLTIKQMNCRANNIIQHSNNPRQLLPCLVLVTGIEPTLLLKNGHQNLTSVVSTSYKFVSASGPVKI